MMVKEWTPLIFISTTTIGELRECCQYDQVGVISHQNCMRFLGSPLFLAFYKLPFLCKLTWGNILQGSSLIHKFPPSWKELQKWISFTSILHVGWVREQYRSGSCWDNDPIWCDKMGWQAPLSCFYPISLWLKTRVGIEMPFQ
jgi:hypothetical protein